MNSLEAWKNYTAPKPEPISAGKVLVGAMILFAAIAFWPLLADSDEVRMFIGSAIVCGIPGGLILLACRASHGKGEARSALGGVAILVLVLVLFALLF